MGQTVKTKAFLFSVIYKKVEDTGLEPAEISVNQLVMIINNLTFQNCDFSCFFAGCAPVDFH